MRYYKSVKREDTKMTKSMSKTYVKEFADKGTALKMYFRLGDNPQVARRTCSAVAGANIYRVTYCYYR